MNDTARKALTEFCPEIEKYISHSADKIAWLLTQDERDGLIFCALVKRLRETGKWSKFRAFAFKTWWNDPTLLASMPYDSTINAIFEDLLLDSARFAGLVAGWLGLKEEI
jgi:hypothetical protein